MAKVFVNNKADENRMKRSSGGNGHGSGPVDAAGVLNPGWAENVFKDQEMPSAFKELTHPGKDVLELLMRTTFDSEDEINAAILYYHKCEEFRDEDGKRLLLSKLAAKPSLGGKSRDQLLQALTGQLRMDQQAFNRKKKSRRDDNEDDED